MEKNKVLNTIIVAISAVLLTELVILFFLTNNKKTEASQVIAQKNIIATIDTNIKKIIENGIMQYNKGENTEEPKEFYIKVNYQENVVTIYCKDSNGNFTKPYKAMVCSTGKATPTSGTYKISDKGKWGMMVGRVWAQYYSRITGQILFHSVPYTSKSPGTLEYWEYDKLGTTASAGCVRLTVEDAKWIFDNCMAGTEVEFYADSNPGPLGKPEALKISGADVKVRGWDPTDTNEGNPWKNL